MAEENVPGTETEEENETVVETEESEKTKVEDDKVSKADYDRVFARMQAADRAKTESEKKLSEIEKAKLGDLELAKTERDEAVKMVTNLEKVVHDLRVENAFHRENKYTWHDPADALSALNMANVSIGEDGTVEGLKAAIDDVAKRKPHFVKKDDNSGPKPVASGEPVNGKRQGSKVETADRAALSKRFPALNK